jgi:hypothetical protein
MEWLLDDALLRMSLRTDGATVDYSRVGRRSSNWDDEPYSALATEMDQYLTRFYRGPTNWVRLKIIREAQDAATARVDRSAVRGTPEWRRKIAMDPRSVRIKKKAYGCSQRTIEAAERAFAPRP